MRKQDFLDVMREPTERDTQRTIGASQYSSGCARCVTRVLRGEPEPDSKYWLGAWIGTAIHHYLEGVAPSNWSVEQRVVVGEIPGYAVIKSTTDLYVHDQQTVVDYKTTTRAKLAAIRNALKPEKPYDTTAVKEARFKLNSYLQQVTQYAWAIAQTGKPVKRVGLLFICRDGVTENDIEYIEINFQEKVAIQTFSWLNEMYERRNEEFAGTPHCYVCEKEGSV